MPLTPSDALWRVAILRPPFAELTYAAPSYPDGGWSVGLRVLVPLGKALAVGVLLAPEAEAPGEHALKELLWPLERTPLLDTAYLELAATLAARHAAPLGQVLAALLPAGLRTAQVRFRLDGFDFPSRMIARDLTALEPRRREQAALLWREGRMEVAARRPSGHDWLRLACDPPWPLRPGALRQAEILDYLFDNGPAPRARLLAALGQNAAAPLRTLIKREAVLAGPEPLAEEEVSCAAEPGLARAEATNSQQAAVDGLAADLDRALMNGESASRLLFGVTGSGKTLVYLRLALRCLKAGRPALILAPEVALACAVWKTAQEYFQAVMPEAEVMLSHGYQAPARKEAHFFRAAQGEPLVVVGTRSALFLPLSAPGLIVVDEEHDESYKQEERLAYQAKEVAWFRARQAGALLLLGSATPDVKTFHAAHAGGLGLVELPRRVGRRPLPEMRLVDIRDPKQAPLAQETLSELHDALEAGDQALIMLNRRGYAPLMYCLDCEATLKCRECEVGLTYHKARERLLCHYCGLSLGFPLTCPTCGGSNFLTMGEGTEQLEERLTQLLPEDTVVLRLDRDAARRQERMEQILRDFAAGKAQVLVGTQMLSKGHNFPQVTRVVVADGDLGLNLPDYRAAERSFQLLVQVAGRAGRGDKPGRVLIQTRNPAHPVWGQVMHADYRSFYEREIGLRERFGYPPFTRLALIRASYPAGMEGGAQWLGEISRVLRTAGTEAGVRVLGPAPAPLAMLRGRKRFNCLLKAADWPGVRRVFAAARHLAKPGADERLSLDLDPVNML